MSDATLAPEIRRLVPGWIATALIRAFGRMAKDRGGWFLFVQSDHGDRAAIGPYGSLGTREEVLHFDSAPG